MAYKIIIDPATEARFRANREAHQKAKADLRDAERAVSEARQEQVRIERAWEAGDASIEPHAYATAGAVTRRAEGLLTAARGREHEAGRIAEQGDVDVALAIAWQIQDEALYQSDIIVSDTEPGKPKAGIPYVVQAGSTKHLGAGWIAGDASVILYGPTRLIASWRGDEIAKHLHSRGFSNVHADTGEPEQIGPKLWKVATSVTISHTGYTGYAWSPYPDVSRSTSPHGTPSYGDAGLDALLHSLVAKYTPDHLGSPYRLTHQITPLGERREGENVVEKWNLWVRMDVRESHVTTAQGYARTALRGALLDLERVLIPSLGTVWEVEPGGIYPTDALHYGQFQEVATITTKRKLPREDEDADEGDDYAAVADDWDTEDVQEPVDATDWDDADEPDYDRTPDLDASERRAA